MNQARRNAMVASPHTIFRRQSQRDDFLNPKRTNDNLAAIVCDLLGVGWNIEFTSVRTDHGDDSGLGEGGHAMGNAFDCWPLLSTTRGDFVDDYSPLITRFLSVVARNAHVRQIGLTKTIYTAPNLVVTRGLAFLDSGDPHIHIGCYY